MTQSVLRTDRLVLAPLAEEHLADEIELDADPAVMRYLAAGRPRTPAETTARHRARLAVAAAAPGFGFWAGTLDGEFVGWWILEPPEPPDDSSSPRPEADGRQAELGYRLLPRWWRRGLATEGARSLVGHGFEHLGLDRVFALTMAVNAASRATMAAVGLRYVRTFDYQAVEGEALIPGWEEGEVEYAVTREEWPAAGGGVTAGPARP